MVKSKRYTRSSSKNQKTLDQYEKISVLEKLTEKQLKIIKLLNDGFYQAAIARRLHCSKGYICRFVKQLRYHNLITTEFVNPINRRATSYRVSKELGEMVSKIETGTTTKADFSLFTPHKVRYKRKCIATNKPVALNVSRFAAAKFKHKWTWWMQGGYRHLFEMHHERVGRIGIIVHPTSIEYYQAYRHHIIAKDIYDATNNLSMALEEAATRFRQEQGWCGVDLDYGEPQLVTSPHYAAPSKLARTLTDAGQTNLQFADGALEIDKSLEKKKREKKVAEIEGEDVEVADIVDRGLRNAAKINEIVPALVRDELKSVSEQILGINDQKEKIDTMCNNVQALCQSGLPLQNSFNQLTGIVAEQGLAITKMQENLLKILENMGKLIDAGINKPQMPVDAQKEPEPVIKKEKGKEWQSSILRDFSIL